LDKKRGKVPDANFRNIMKTIITLFMAFAIRLAAASPLDDLASPVQAVRDNAARELRASYQAIPRSKWEPVLEKIKEVQTKGELLKLLSPFHVTMELSLANGRSHYCLYRLVNEWTLNCWFENESEKLYDHKIGHSPKPIWVAPPKDYTGKWIAYFVNGQKSHEVNYKQGQYFGEFISFHPDGSRSYVQHYSEKGADGKDTGYYPSGKVRYHARYKDGKPVGTWVHYDESGNITSSREQH
jgi:hypothetical protein